MKLVTGNFTNEFPETISLFFTAVKIKKTSQETEISSEQIFCLFLLVFVYFSSLYLKSALGTYFYKSFFESVLNMPGF